MRRELNDRFNSLMAQTPRELDFIILVIMVFLAGGGFLLVMSASTQYSERYFDEPFHYALRHLVLVGFGLLAMFAAWMTPMQLWMRTSPWLLFFSLLVLLLVFIPGIGREVNMSSRWIDLRFFTVQPAEILKFTVPVFYAFYLTRHAELLRESGYGLILPLGLIAIICMLLLLQPDFGSAFILAMAVFTVLFLAGMRWRDCALLGVFFIALNVLLITFQPYRLKRLACMKDGNIWEQFLSHCYQIGHSLIAIERGGLFGVGLGGSIQKYSYLPEAHTDFSFSIIAEELGFVFCLLFVAVFLIFVMRVMHIARRSFEAGSYFAAYLLYAVGALWISRLRLCSGHRFAFTFSELWWHEPINKFLSRGGSATRV